MKPFPSLSWHSQVAIDALTGSNACLLANHGMIAVGVDLPKTFALAEQVENLCEVYWRTLQVSGGPDILDEREMAVVQEKFKSYGKQGGADRAVSTAGAARSAGSSPSSSAAAQAIRHSNPPSVRVVCPSAVRNNSNRVNHATAVGRNSAFAASRGGASRPSGSSAPWSSSPSPSVSVACPIAAKHNNSRRQFGTTACDSSSPGASSASVRGAGRCCGFGFDCVRGAAAAALGGVRNTGPALPRAWTGPANVHRNLAVVLRRCKL